MSDVPMGITTDMVQAIVWSLFNKAITIPPDFHGQCQKIMEIYDSDSTGFIDTITDFMVECALTEFSAQTKTSETTYAGLLNKWLENINSTWRGKPGIEVGIRGFAKQYFKERWKYSSFPVVQIVSFKKKIRIDNNVIKVPEGLFILDGCSIYSDKKNSNENVVTLFDYDYYLGKPGEGKKLEGRNYLITKSSGRIFDEYPKPFLMRRGVYKNWKILDILKDKQGELIHNIVPYILLLEKGLKSANNGQKKAFSPESLEQSVEKLQKIIEGAAVNQTTPLRASNEGDKLSDYIPSIENMFKQALFTQGEKAILSGLGLIDLMHVGEVSRQESTINPKPMMQEVYAGVKDFMMIMSDLIAYINEDNKKHPKLVSAGAYMHFNPITVFSTDAFKKAISEAHARGNISEQLYSELVPEANFNLEVKRRRQEAKDGIEQDTYPRVIRNQEQYHPNLTEDFTKDGEPVAPDKIPGSPQAKEKFTTE